MYIGLNKLFVMEFNDVDMLGGAELTFEQLLGNNFPDNFDFEAELEENTENFEKILFASSQDVPNDTNVHSILTAEEAEKLLSAMDVDTGKL